MMPIKYLTALLTSLMLAGCATKSINNFPAFQATPLGHKSTHTNYILKTDNLLVISDISLSTNAVYEGGGFQEQSSVSKFDAGQELLRRINLTIPENVGLNAGIRSFGFGPCTAWGFSKLNLAVSNYSTSSFASGLDSITCNSGGSPMHKALEAASDDLAATVGNSAIVIISAGHQLDASPFSAAKMLKQKYGDRLCIYTVWVGNEASKGGRNLMLKLANIGGCGFATSAADIAASPDMADFVERVLFTKASAATKAKASPFDSDADGVADYKDKCPQTPAGAKVDIDGCWAYHGVFFDFDKATIKPEYHDLFENAVQVMKNNPTLRVQIEGHTDSIGPASYNLKLSERRAQAVKAYMVNKGISPARITTQGFGEIDPVKG